MELLLQLDLVGPETLPLLLLAAGLLLAVAEAIAPGANFIVVGIALLGAGLVGLALGPLASPFVLGLLVLLFGGLAFYGYHELDVYGGKGQAQTRDSSSLKGETGRVTETVSPTGGEIKIAGAGFNPYYTARSLEETIEEGEEVLVVDPGGGNVVTVTPLGAVEDDIDRELAADRARKSGSDDGDTPRSETSDEGVRERERESDRA